MGFEEGGERWKVLLQQDFISRVVDFEPCVVKSRQRATRLQCCALFCIFCLFVGVVSTADSDTDHHGECRVVWVNGAGGSTPGNHQSKPLTEAEAVAVAGGGGGGCS